MNRVRGTAARSVTVTGANLFALAAEYLGDASQWWRIAALNQAPGEAPDFLVPGPATLRIPAADRRRS